METPSKKRYHMPADGPRDDEVYAAEMEECTVLLKASFPVVPGTLNTVYLDYNRRNMDLGFLAASFLMFIVGAFWFTLFGDVPGMTRSGIAMMVSGAISVALATYFRRRHKRAEVDKWREVAGFGPQSHAEAIGRFFENVLVSSDEDVCVHVDVAGIKLMLRCRAGARERMRVAWGDMAET